MTEHTNEWDLYQRGIEYKSRLGLYSTVEEMINSDYLSPAAKAIADEIKSYREDLNAMTRKISRYGEFCKNASNKVIRNDTNIVNSIK